MDEELRERLEALERAVTDGEGDFGALADGAATAERVDDLAARVDELEDAVADLEAATQALRGYVGQVRSVNDEVEATATEALTRVESLEANLEANRRDEDTRGADLDRCVQSQREPTHDETIEQPTPAGSRRVGDAVGGSISPAEPSGADQRPGTGDRPPQDSGSLGGAGPDRSDAVAERHRDEREHEHGHAASNCPTCGRPETGTDDADEPGTAGRDLDLGGPADSGAFDDGRLAADGHGIGGPDQGDSPRRRRSNGDGDSGVLQRVRDLL